MARRAAAFGVGPKRFAARRLAGRNYNTHLRVVLERIVLDSEAPCAPTALVSRSKVPERIEARVVLPTRAAPIIGLPRSTSGSDRNHLRARASAADLGFVRPRPFCGRPPNRFFSGQERPSRCLHYPSRTGALSTISGSYSPFGLAPRAGTALMSDLAEFVEFYTPALDRPRVAFAWNGRHADHFADANENFRRRLLKHVLRDLSAAPIELVRDLFDAETAWAQQAWCVNAEGVRALARELLTRGGPGFVEDFLTGKVGRGMDAFCAAYFECPRGLAEQLLAEVERRLAEGADGSRRGRLEAGRDIFRGWVAEDRPDAPR